jgi:hypothetical protein
MGTVEYLVNILLRDRKHSSNLRAPANRNEDLGDGVRWAEYIRKLNLRYEIINI